MRLKVVLVLLLVAVATLALRELACTASELLEASQPPSRAPIYTDAVEPELPAVHELEVDEPRALPALTR